MKKIIIPLSFLLLANFSCKSRFYESIYIQSFTENSKTFEKTVSYLQAQKGAIGFSTNKAVVFFDTALLNNPKYLSPLKDSLSCLFELNKFNAVTYYSSGEIEFLMNLKKDDFTLTETKMIVLYSASNELPFPYLHWSKQKKIKDNWWYLENICAEY